MWLTDRHTDKAIYSLGYIFQWKMRRTMHYSPSICGGKVNVFQILDSERQSCRWSRQTCSSWQLVETGVCHLSRLVPVLSHNVKRLLENQKARAPRPQRTSVSLIQFCKVLLLPYFLGWQQPIFLRLIGCCDIRNFPVTIKLKFHVPSNWNKRQ